jgi:acyl-CoA thioesterase II
VKTSGTLKSKGQAIHSIALAYLSDAWFIGTALRVYGIGREGRSNGTMIVSLDHAIYFHRPFRADDWLLYERGSSGALNNVLKIDK